MPGAPDRDVIAYLITFRTYGTWLPGDDRGWVTRRDNSFGTPVLEPDLGAEMRSRKALRAHPLILSPDQRRVVDMAVREVCAHRDWLLHAINARTNHVHVVVSADAPPERVLRDFKARGTRALRLSGLLHPAPWAGHGSTGYLWDDEQLARAVDYVLNRQDVSASDW
jgi:REP element-mobilizing transposase RayT